MLPRAGAGLSMEGYWSGRRWGGAQRERMRTRLTFFKAVRIKRVCTRVSWAGSIRVRHLRLRFVVPRPRVFSLLFFFIRSTR